MGTPIGQVVPMPSVEGGLGSHGFASVQPHAQGTTEVLPEHAQHGCQFGVGDQGQGSHGRGTTEVLPEHAQQGCQIETGLVGVGDHGHGSHGGAAEMPDQHARPSLRPPGLDSPVNSGPPGLGGYTNPIIATSPSVLTEKKLKQVMENIKVMMTRQ